MNRRRLLGISCALVALALAPAAPSAHAQLLPPPLPVPLANQAPVVNAGADQVITLPGIANLTGAAIDDGQPNPPGALTTTWSQVSGPGTVSFSNASALNSTATFSASGAYVLRLTVSDGALTVSDGVAVTVNPAPAQLAAEAKIDPALRDLMQANPQALLPVIVEMQHPTAPFVSAPDVDRALAALDLLRQYGTPVAALSLIDAAAGFANAAGINAISLVPTVARIHHDATVGPRRSADPPVVAPPDQVSEIYPLVVRGIEWVLAHRAVYNIRVISLSFGARANLSYRADPMAAAVEIAWRRGLVVVAASGNGGPAGGTVDTPGIDPYAITVGATDDRGTLGRGDDLLAWFSAWGSADSNAKPDLVAPGRRIVSIRVPGSALDTLFPDRIVVARNGSTYFRLTGTSMATGVVSGAAALLLARRPDLSPDQVKALLVSTTQPYGQQSGQVLPDPTAGGSGLLDTYAAMTSALTIPAPPTGGSGGLLGGGLLTGTLQTVAPLGCANRALRPADGFARALFPVLYGSPLHWKDPTLGGIDWQALTWDSVVWDSIAWDNFAWDSVAWDSVAWDSVAWDSVAWDSVAWDSVAWDSVAWDAFTLD